MLAPYVSYLQDRWQAGCTNVAQLHREITALGFAGSRSLLSQAVQAWRGPRLSTEERRKLRRMTKPRSLRWLCLCPPEQLKPEEQVLLARLLAGYADLRLGYQLLQSVREVIASREQARLVCWLEEAKASKLPTFVSLANGLEVDRAAVDAALSLPWSTGPVEGQINRVKLLKRQGYGRAKLDLLRLRVLAA